MIVFPHANWRDDYTVGTYEGGRTSLCVLYPNNPVDQTPVGEDPGVTEPLPGDSSRYCFAGVQWPAAHLWMDHGLRDPRPKAAPGFWAGSLIHNKRDLSGNLYMRNRYYDPSSGRFTQEDPIGIAGGLNTYGFANGDPANYNDPYGLCADSQFRKRGILGAIGIGRTTCPGGLSRSEYRRIEGMIQNHFDSEAGGRLQGMLESGRVGRVRRTAHDREAEAIFGIGINVADKFFATQHDGDAAWILGHELGHNIQWQHGMLIQEIGTGVRPNLGRIRRLMRTEGLESDPEFNNYQNDANAYACAHVTGMDKRQGHCTQ